MEIKGFELGAIDMQATIGIRQLPSQAGSKTRTPVEIKIVRLYQSRYK